MVGGERMGDVRYQARVRIPKALARQIVAEQGGLCCTCGCGLTEGTLTASDPEIHHLIPVASGGGNDRANLRALCWACHHWLPEECARRDPTGAYERYRASRGRLGLVDELVNLPTVRAAFREFAAAGGDLGKMGRHCEEVANALNGGGDGR